MKLEAPAAYKVIIQLHLLDFSCVYKNMVTPKKWKALKNI